MEFLETLFGEGISVTMLVVYFLFGVFGIFTSMILDVYSSGIKLSAFSWKRWLFDNGFRTVLSLIVVILAITFGEELVGIKTANWSMFLAGLTNDKIIETFIQRKRKTTK